MALGDVIERTWGPVPVDLSQDWREHGDRAREEPTKAQLGLARRLGINAARHSKRSLTNAISREEGEDAEPATRSSIERLAMLGVGVPHELKKWQADRMLSAIDRWGEQAGQMRCPHCKRFQRRLETQCFCGTVFEHRFELDLDARTGTESVVAGRPIGRTPRSTSSGPPASRQAAAPAIRRANHVATYSVVLAAVAVAAQISAWFATATALAVVVIMFGGIGLILSALRRGVGLVAASLGIGLGAVILIWGDASAAATGAAP